MKVLVTGGRKFHKTDIVYGVLDHLHKKHCVKELITGDAVGTDTLAAAWAFQRSVLLRECQADWKKYGLAAGPIRNSQMLNLHKPDVVVVFPGGRGTNDMHAKARAAKVPVVLVNERGVFSGPKCLGL